MSTSYKTQLSALLPHFINILNVFMAKELKFISNVCIISINSWFVSTLMINKTGFLECSLEFTEKIQFTVD